MTRIVVYLGAERIGSETIQRGLFANQDELAGQGILVPQTGRLDSASKSVRHHLLPWSLAPRDGQPPDEGIWESLAEEVGQSSAATAVLASGHFSRLAADPSLAPEVVRRLLSVSDDVTLVLFAGDQLANINSLYCRRLRLLDESSDFDTYLRDSPAVGRYDYAETFRPWYEEPSVRFVAVPWGSTGDTDALAALLDAADVPVDKSRLVRVVDVPEVTLGPIAVEAIRLLTAALPGRFPDFDPNEPAARRLRVKAAKLAASKGWCEDQFWGWSPHQAARAADGYAASNHEFARRTGIGDWPLPTPLDETPNTADLVELPGGVINRIHQYVHSMERAFERLRTAEVDA